MLKSTTRVDSQKVLDLAVSDCFGRGPGYAHLPHRCAGEYDVAVLHGWGKQAQSALRYGRLCGNCKPGYDPLIDHQVRSDVFAQQSRPTEIHGVGISIMNDVKFTPEHAIHGRAILHTRHI